MPSQEGNFLEGVETRAYSPFGTMKPVDLELVTKSKRPTPLFALKRSDVMAYIYGIQNKINQKWYIGQSKYYPHERWRQHIAGYKNTSISKAIKKYGEELFDFMVLEEVSEKELDEKEIYYIQLYDSYKNGYNETRGGVHPELGHRLPVTPDEIISYYQSHDKLSCRDVAQHFGVFHETVSTIITKAGLSLRYGKRSVTIQDLRTGELFNFNTYMEASKFIIANNHDYPRSTTTVRKHFSNKNCHTYRDYKIIRHSE